MSDFIKGPKLSEREMQVKLDEVRRSVSDKMDTWGSKLQFSMHSTPKIQRVEGERWIEDGKTWIQQKNGKVAASVLQEARMPHWCPRCSISMTHRFDRKFYYLRGFCFNCNVEVENQMRLDGTWEEFEKRTIRENEKSYLRDKIQEHLDYIRTFRPPQAHFENGGWEELAPLSAFKEKFEELQKDVDFMLLRLDQIMIEEQEEINAKQNT